MIRHIRKLTLLAIITVLSFILTACSEGSTLNTVMTLNPDFSGERVMTVEINQTALEESFDGTLEDLQQLVIDNCPDFMTYAFDEENANMTFTLAFDSQEDYLTKIQTLIEEDAGFEYRLSEDNPWASGLYYIENFDSSEVLYWLQMAIINAGYVDELDRNYMFTIGTTELVYDGQTEQTYDYITVDSSSFLPIESIDILTDIGSDNHYTRQVIIKASTEVVTPKADKIDDYMSELDQNLYDYQKEVKGDAVYYTYTGENLDFDALEEMDQSLFGEENVSFNTRTISDDSNVFSSELMIDESISLMNFINFNENETKISYLIRMDEPNGQISFVTSNMTTTDLTDFDESTFYPDYYLIDYQDEQYENSLKYSSRKNNGLVIDSIDMITRVIDEGQYFSRDVTLNFTETLSEEEANKLSEFFTYQVDMESLAYNDFHNPEHFNYSVTAEDNTLTLSGEGNSEEFTDLFGTLLGYEMIEYRVDENYIRPKSAFYYSESLDLHDLASETDSDFQLNHIVIFDKMNHIDKDEYGEYQLEDDGIHILQDGKSQEIFIVGATLNVPTLIVYGLIILVLILIPILFAIIVIRVKNANKRKTGSVEAHKEHFTMNESVPVIDSEPVTEPQPELETESETGSNQKHKQDPKQGLRQEHTHEPNHKPNQGPKHEHKQDSQSKTKHISETVSPQVTETLSQARFCTNCGTPCDGDSVFCSNCGAKIE